MRSDAGAKTASGKGSRSVGLEPPAAAAGTGAGTWIFEKIVKVLSKEMGGNTNTTFLVQNAKHIKGVKDAQDAITILSEVTERAFPHE